MKSLFAATVKSILDTPDLFDDVQGAYVYRDIEVPCRHRWWTRLWDKLHDDPHGRTHTIAEPLIRVALLDHEPLSDGETVTLNWSADGILRVD
jgi:hypothetical protein